MKDKSLLMEAIDNYDAYSPKQREILKALVGISINDIAVITVARLVKQLDTTKPTVYSSLARLKDDEIIISMNKERERLNTYKLNSTKLDHIVTAYKKNLEFFEKNFKK
jgi:DNA-binding transcriptional ArsR family regulator